MIKDSSQLVGVVSAKSNLEVLSAISHDLKLPLQSILGISSLLEDDLTAEELKEQSARLQLLASRGLELIDGLLLAGQVRAEQVSLELAPINLASVAETVAQKLRPLALRYGRDIQINPSESLTPAMANQIAVVHCMAGILDSVVRSSHSEVIEVLIHNQLDSVMLTIRDDGQPFNDSSIRRILRGLGYSTQPAKVLPSSSGLAIYVAAVLSEAMDGRLAAYTKNGKRAISLAFNQSTQLNLL